MPQGSVLGPTLFLLYINDITDIVAGLDVKLKLFADDAKLYSAFSIDSSVDLEVTCMNLSIWAELWQLRISSEKCCVHRITNKLFYADNVHCSYALDSTQLKWSNETRDLGVIIDSKLNFNKHANVIVHKAHARARASAQGGRGGHGPPVKIRASR